MILNAIKLMERAARLDPDVISLSQGIPFQQSDTVIRQAAISAITRGSVDQYSDPQGIPELRNAISDILWKQQMPYDPDEIIITAGAIEGLNAVLHTLISPDRDEIIMPTPVYAAYERCVSAARGTAIPVKLQERNGWRLDRAALEQAISPRTAAILICNPNNPTGSVYDEATIRWLVTVAVEHDIVLISDEVYGNMLYEQAGLFSPAMVDAARRQVIRVVSFSKDFALTGWRVGFVQADRSLIPQIVGMHDTLINCAPVVSQYAALAAIGCSERIIAANLRSYRRQRQIMCGYLDRLGPRVSYIKPAGAYFIFVRITGVRDITGWCLRLLDAQKVAVVPGDDFGPGGEGCVRLCFGRSSEAVHEGMQRFSAYVRQGIVE